MTYTLFYDIITKVQCFDFLCTELFVCSKGVIKTNSLRKREKMYKVIIVDDEKLIRNGLITYINEEIDDFKVVGDFSDGQEALDYLEDNQDSVDVVITDIRMEKMSGIELAEQIRKRNIDVLIVFISGYEEFEYARKAIDFKVYSYLLKPMRFEQLDKLFSGLLKELNLIKKNELEMNEEIQNAMIIHLINEIEIGTICDESKIRARAKKLNLPEKLLTSPCGYIRIKKEFSDTKNLKYTQEQYDTIIMNLINKNQFSLYKTHSDKTSITLFVSGEDNIEFEEFKHCVYNSLDAAVSDSNADMNFSVGIAVKNCFYNVFELSDYFMTINSDYIIDNIRNVFFADLTIGDFDTAQRSLELLDERLIGLGKIQRELVWNEFLGTLNRITGNINNDIDIEKKEVLTNIRKNKDEFYKEKIVTLAMEYIDENFCEDISLVDVAENVHLNSVYLARIFKEKYKETVMDCIIRKRMFKLLF